MSMICCGTKASRISSFRPHQTPPWLLSFFFALQHLLVQASLLCSSHSLLLHHRPLPPSHHSRLLASSLFACGIATSLQSALGTRLPLLQTPTFELLIPAIILSRHSAANSTSPGIDFLGGENCTGADCGQVQNGIQPIREVSGALVISGIFQILSGFFGLWGWILQFCGPMVIAPALSIIGLSCYKPAALLCSSNWGISMGLITVTAFLSQNLRSLRIPVLLWSKKGRAQKRYAPVLRMLSMFLPISCIWIVCSVWLREQTAFPSEVLQEQNASATAAELAPWFHFPSLGAWGWPQLSLETLGVGTAMGLTSCLSSLGCYILCARMLQCPPLPSHSCNRGICMEGVGNILSGMLGGVCGVGSNIPSAGITGITQVGSRHSAHLSALLFIVLGCSPRLSQILMTIPFAVHGGTLSLTFSMAVGGGVSFFQYADIDSGRNIFIVGFTMFMALLVPRWLDAMPTRMDTGWPAVDMLLLSLLTTPIFLGGLFSFVLDNTVEGSLEERGLHKNVSLWPSASKDTSRKGMEKQMAQAYSLPPALCRLFPAMYPFTQLCPPLLDPAADVEGEDHKLLSLGAAETDVELKWVQSTENCGSEAESFV
ncbi:solute carrier family 23 member 3 [Hyperolius riggenbachi]|uniref:solute carrier family 23 member 3 n=1 Tax=Hyperolius riggenbachi TaxID=752182 RepID=UPI0035A2C134